MNNIKSSSDSPLLVEFFLNLVELIIWNAAFITTIAIVVIFALLTYKKNFAICLAPKAAVDPSDIHDDGFLETSLGQKLHS